ncbi:50S ribosomal protein L31 [Pseudomonas fluorescens WH6]|nr:50S ribosomal protein L31 [Pseudomonas fluorescens WH6]
MRYSTIVSSGGTLARGSAMKADIHPAYETIEVTCSCGNKFETRSNLCKPLGTDVCNECHPFYTGKQKTLDTGGRVQRFADRFGAFGKKPAAATPAE